MEYVILLTALLLTFNLASSEDGCLQLKGGISNTKTPCCQCRANPPIFHCPGRCLTGFYPTNKTATVCDSLTNNLPSPGVTVATIGAEELSHIANTTRPFLSSTIESGSHNGTMHFYTTVSGSNTVTVPSGSSSEKDTMVSSFNFDSGTTKPSGSSDKANDSKTDTKGSGSKSETSTVSSRLTSDDGTARPSSGYENRTPGLNSSSDSGTTGSSSTSGTSTQVSNLTSDIGITESRSSNDSGATTSTFYTGSATVACKRCHEACAGCVGPGANNCIRCAEGFEVSSSSESTSTGDGGFCIPKIDEINVPWILVLLALLFAVLVVCLWYHKCFKRHKRNMARNRNGDGQGETENGLNNEQHVLGQLTPEQRRGSLNTDMGTGNTVTSHNPSNATEDKIHCDIFNSTSNSVAELYESSMCTLTSTDENLNVLNASISTKDSFLLGTVDVPSLGDNTSATDTSAHVASQEERYVEQGLTDSEEQTSVPKKIYNTWAAAQNFDEKVASKDVSNGKTWPKLPTLEEKRSSNDEGLLTEFYRRKPSITMSITPNYIEGFGMDERSSVVSDTVSRASSGFISEIGSNSDRDTIRSANRVNASTTPASDTVDGTDDQDSGCGGYDDEESVPDLRKVISDHSNSLNLLDNYFTSSSTQTCDSLTAPAPYVSNAWQFSKQLSYNGGTVKKEHSDVILEIPEGAIGNDESVTIREAVCVDLRTAALVLKIPQDEVLVSPVVEFFSGQDHKFKKSVLVVLPILPSADKEICVYHFCLDEAGQLRLQQLRKVYQNEAFPGWAGNTTPGTYSVQQGSKVFVYIDRFSGVCCTKLKCQALCSLPDLWLELFAQQLKSSVTKWEVELQLEIWDNDIQDFRHDRRDRDSLNCGQMVKVDGKRLSALTLNDDAINVNDVIAKIGLHVQLELVDKSAEEWMHLTRDGDRFVFPREERLDLKRFILCENHRSHQPERKDWSLTNKDNIIPSEGFSCCVDVVYDVETGITTEPKRVTFKISLPLADVTLQTADTVRQSAVRHKIPCSSCGNAETRTGSENPGSTTSQKYSDTGSKQTATQNSSNGRQDSTTIYADTVVIGNSNRVNDNTHANASRTDSSHEGREETVAKETNLPVRVNSSNQAVSVPVITPFPVPVENPGERFGTGSTEV